MARHNTLLHINEMCSLASWLALEPKLLVLGGHVVPEQLQGLPHCRLGISPEVPRMFFSNDTNNYFRNELYR